MSRSKGKKKVNPPARTDREALLESWGIAIDAELLELALIHRSWSFENGKVPTNERLELLGDSVLSLVVTEKLYREFPDKSEAELVPLRAAAVSEEPLADIAKRIHLDEFILLGNGELVTDGRNKPSILSDAVEALIAATYLTHGLEPTRAIVEAHTSTYLSGAAIVPGSDWKTAVQMVAQSAGLGEVTYDIEASGPDHAKRYRATCRIADRVYGSGESTAKAKAELAAAKATYPMLDA
ncbi:MAG: ribonuclease III [Flaviflexus sp.]|nr:ribonuclease III [Flaviflexus sp.]